MVYEKNAKPVIPYKQANLSPKASFKKPPSPPRSESPDPGEVSVWKPFGNSREVRTVYKAKVPDMSYSSSSYIQPKVENPYLKLLQEQESIALFVRKQILENVMEDLICELYEDVRQEYRPPTPQVFRNESNFIDTDVLRGVQK